MGEARRVVEEAQCGYCCPPDDPQSLAGLCTKLVNLEASQRLAMGESGREYYARHFSKKQFFESLECELSNLVGTRHGATL
jgi:glycosyltransferase involved in cell wall biosynthesis